ncbi:MAG: hypothetical protein WB686_02660, partial [Pseudolabrys sp.]
SDGWISRFADGRFILLSRQITAPSGAIVAIASWQGSITNTSRYDLWKEHGHSGDSGIGWGDCYL